MKSLFAVIMLSVVLSGCAIYTPSGAVIIDPVGSGGNGHCPPGQAKKGNC
ncbi:MAG: hypothetical protein V4730_07060 [Pseudomonadota bacterium]